MINFIYLMGAEDGFICMQLVTINILTQTYPFM